MKLRKSYVSEVEHAERYQSFSRGPELNGEAKGTLGGDLPHKGLK